MIGAPHPTYLHKWIDWLIKITRKEEPGNLILEPRRATMIFNLLNKGGWVGGFEGQYLPSLSINYVAINKDMEKLPPTAVLNKDEKLSWSELQ